MEENNITVETKPSENNIPEINSSEDNTVNIKDGNTDTDKCSEIVSKDINHLNDVADNNTSVETAPKENFGLKDAPETNICPDIDAINPLENTFTSDTGTNISPVCKVCSYQAVYTKRRSGRSALCCHECNDLVHFQCTRLPPYMLYNLSITSKRYICELCAAAPESFLLNLISEDAKNIVSNAYRVSAKPEEPSEEQEGRYERLEKKVSELCEVVEKYDIPRVADKIQTVYENIFKINNEFIENITLLGKSTFTLEKSVNSNEKSNDDRELKEKVDTQASELKALKASEKLFLDSLCEKDKLITNLMNGKEKHLKSINELNSDNQSLRSQTERYANIESERLSLENMVTGLKNENNRLNAILSELKSSCSGRENELDHQCQQQQTEIRAKQDIINVMDGTMKKLQENLSEALKRRDSAPPPSDPVNSVTTTVASNLTAITRDSSTRDSGTPVTPNVVIFHDSMCNRINTTMMNRENVTITKMWGPTLSDTQVKVVDIDHVERIVLQCLTREVGDMSTEDFTHLTFNTVEKCLTKADKVIVSLIVDREDDYEIRAKAEAANAMIKLKYINNPNVLVCHHDNLRDRKFKGRDLLHLTDPASRLANNLKFKIAESLDIQVVKKKKNEDSNRYERYNENHGYVDRYNRDNNRSNNEERGRYESNNDRHENDTDYYFDRNIYRSNNNGDDKYDGRYQKYRSNDHYQDNVR